jgi:hypothetical protein
MQLINLFSELLLTVSGFAVFFVLMRNLNLANSILWGTFPLAVAVTAFFSVLFYAGVSGMDRGHDFFVSVSSSFGVVLLVMGAYSLAFKRTFSEIWVYSIFLSGIALVFVMMYFKQEKILSQIPFVGIVLVFILGIVAIVKEQTRSGRYLVLAAVFAIMANTYGLLQLPVNQLTVYCTLLSFVLLFFGLAAKQHGIESQ